MDHKAEIEAVARIAIVPTILDVICRTTGMGFAAVARVTEFRWIACGVLDRIQFGMQPGDELKVETTICHEIRQSGDPVVINDVSADALYCGHPSPVAYGFQSYISMPIILRDGTFFGTLCAIDPKPRTLDTPETTGTFRLFAELIAFHLDADAKLAEAAATLVREREVSEFREQFIAVLGHDLRNPLAAVAAGTGLLLRHPERAAEIAGHMGQSIARMFGLIDDVMDFARGRLGDGLAMSRDADAEIGPVLAQVVQELRSAHPDRVIDMQFDLAGPVSCDRSRIAQLLSNLLGNALTHGASTRPVLVRATSDDTNFALSVTNGGEPIPPGSLAKLFQPFFRATVRPNQEGLGLGLYIASEIARAHRGTLDASSNPLETCFTFKMPTGV
ncbi:MAG: GAF domain-containing sensor histidine kinase [Janthinobacterium lividum]